jgi:hypothetical protein
MSTYNNYGYAIARYAIDKLAAAVRLALGAFVDFGWFAPRHQAQRLPQRRTIGKEHKGYARPSRQRTHQRRG